MDDIERFLKRHDLPAHLDAELRLLLASRGPTMVRAPDNTSTIFLGGSTPESEPPVEHDGARDSRYVDLGPIGSGGMAEVRRVRDTTLGRVLAMKIADVAHARTPAMLARFVEEAQTTAQLDHPGVVPVHEIGWTEAGRPYFTMKEVRGRTLADVIEAVHLASTIDAWGETHDGWSLHRLVDAFLGVCDTVAHAHARGVVHRDLKPDNIMVGPFGEVLVMDWGLARTGAEVSSPAQLTPVRTERGQDDSLRTQAGTLAGTPAYMSPEQALGDLDILDARSDVFTLGVVLYHVLYGQNPYGAASMHEVLEWVPKVRLQPPAMRLAIPAELRDLWLACTELAPRDRPRDASILASRLRRWQSGAERRNRALAISHEAQDVLPEVDRLRTRAAEYRKHASLALEQVEPWEPIDAKRAAWELEDEATRLQTRADLEELRATELFRAALTQDPDLPEARSRLADLYHERHAEAEAVGDSVAAARLAVQLQAHDDGRYTAYLQGDGSLTLRTEPAGAEVEAFRFALKDRRLVPEPFRFLGTTPLEDVSLPMGSYVLRLRHPGHSDVRYPVHLGRTGHWEGIPPEGREPAVVRLPPEDALGADDVYVPSGWFEAGGDAESMASGPRMRVWVDAFVIRRFPVTNVEYLTFLNGLVDQGHEQEALRVVPRERHPGGEAGPPAYGRDERGHFALQPDADGDVWAPDWPVLLVNFEGARAFAAHVANTTGQPWRLPWELEWEKAARGVDARLFPWGNHGDPTWACSRDSRSGRALPAAVTDFPVDESVYGVRGLGGNALDWCLDGFSPAGPVVVGQRPHKKLPDDASTARVGRGGAWSHTRFGMRACNRPNRPPNTYNETWTVRLVRDA